MSSQKVAAGIEPVLRLEKPRYVLGESIRFWVGVTSKNSAAIPEELKKPCSLTITRPDGTQKVDSVERPLNEIRGSTWYGGWGFGNEKVEPGRYTLVLDCAGERTPPVELIVERNDILDQINAEFRFDREGVVTKITPVTVVLTVHNDSHETIRFPERGIVGEGIGVRIARKEPPFSSSLPFPQKKLSQSKLSADTYTWDVIPDIPSIVLQPGEHFEQRLLLKDAYSLDQAGDYEITFSTVLSVLVGEKNGPFAGLCPIRLPVTASAQFVLKSSE